MANGDSWAFLKLSFLYVCFFLVSSVLAHSLASYFLGSDVVMAYIKEGPTHHLKAFITVCVMTAVLFINFTFFREKLCFYVCPYGRFQNALIDNNSLTVFYDHLRGEPRGKSTQRSEVGDCVDCNKCVRVCPTKIDIRNGFQMECIACGKCIDACDEIMTKVGRAPKLIRYETGNQKKINLHRFRLYLYFVLFAVFAVAFVAVLLNRSVLDINISRAHEQAFTNRTELAKTVYTNRLQIHLKNTTNQQIKLNLSLSPDNLQEGYSISSPAVSMVLEPEQDIVVPAFVEMTSSQTKPMFELIFEYTHDNRLNKIKKSMNFIRGG